MIKAIRSGFRACHVSCIAALLVFMASSRSSASVVHSNLVLVPLQSFGGTVSSVPIPPAFGEGLETGPITLSLDPDATNVFGLDNAYEQGFIDVTLLLSSPLFTLLGETPRIRIIESGPASVEYVDSYQCGYDFLFEAILTGGGTVENGLFMGTEFHNVNAYNGTGVLGSWIVQLGSTVTWDIQNNGSVTFPDGTTIDNLGGSGLMVVVSEPSTLAMAVVGVLGLAAWRLRRKR